MNEINPLETLMAWAVPPIYIFFIALEFFVGHFINHKEVYNLKDTLISTLMGLLNVVVDLVMRFVIGLAALTYFYNLAPFHWQQNATYWVALVFIQDFAYYALHVGEHYCRFFWAVHNIHHSSEKFNFTVAIRSSVFQPLYKFFYYIPLALLGFKPLDILLVYALSQTYGFFVHTTSVGKLGFLEWFMVTPSHHKVHHATNEEYLDKNMSMVFIIWDKIFGTFKEEKEGVEISFGLSKNLTSFHPKEVIFHEWAAMWQDVKHAPTFSDKLKYVFARPGWKHQPKQTEIKTEKAVLQ